MLQVNINYYIWLILTCNINITDLVSYRGCQLMYRPTSLSTLSVYISVTTSFKCQTKCQLSVDSIGSVSAMYQWAINQVPIRYRWCNVGSTIFITCTIFFLTSSPRCWYQIDQLHVPNHRQFSRIGQHLGHLSVDISIAIGQVVVESQLRVGQCPTAVDRGIGCNID